MPGHLKLAPSLTLVVVILGLLSGCSKTEKEPEPLVIVQAMTVKETSIERVVSTEAVLFPFQQAAITPKANAPVRHFYVNRGDHVKAGQLLATLENLDLAASAAENKGALTQAEATYAEVTAAGIPEEMRKAELEVEATKQALDAEQKLFDSRDDLYSQGALPRKDLDQARVSLTHAKGQYEIAQQHWKALQVDGKGRALKLANGQLESARAKYQGSEAQLSYSEIHSPINGYVTERSLYSGEMAAAGAPLLVIIDTSSIIAKAHVSQQEAALLKVGNPAELKASGTDAEIPAQITMISPAADPDSTTVEIWARVANPGNSLRPGMTVQLSAIAQRVENALVVPSSAILNQPERGTAVMVVSSDNRAHLQTVEVGIQNGNQVQITSGLRAQQQVITSGAYGLPENTRVKIENSDQAGKTASD